MSFKVVLTCLPFFNHVYTPPLPLAYLKAYLQQEPGLTVKVIDLEPLMFRSSLVRNNPILYWDKMLYRDKAISSRMREELDRYIAIILSESPRIVGFSVAHSNYLFTRYVSQELKKADPNLYIIYGGRHFCLRKNFRHFVKKWHSGLEDVDCVVKNEGEATLTEIVRALKEGKRPEFCPGATLRRGPEILDGGDRPLMKDLDAIPFPDFSDFPKEDYLSDYIRMTFSRGCVGRCTYCVENDTMGEYRYRSPQNVLEEIRLRLRQGYRKFQLCDLAVNSNIKNLTDICEQIVREKLDIEFTFSEFRNSPQLTPEVFALLRKAGFHTLCYGTESGCQAILDRMDKRTKVEDIERNFKDAHKQELKNLLYMMVGFPGESEATFQETLSFLKRNRDYIDGVAAIAPTCICSGSRIHEKVEKYDVKKETLFQDPDVWKSQDGGNTLSWRTGLFERMHQALRETGILPADFTVDGNPRIRSFPEQVKTPSSGKGDVSGPPFGKLYSAKLTALTSEHDISVKESFTFLIEVVNTGEAVWLKDGGDWVRAGCQIFSTDGQGPVLLTELRQEIPFDIQPGAGFQVIFRMKRSDFPVKNISLKFDMVNEGKFWFGNQGNEILVVSV